jgi:hypothetical protein
LVWMGRKGEKRIANDGREVREAGRALVEHE